MFCRIHVSICVLVALLWSLGREVHGQEAAMTAAELVDSGQIAFEQKDYQQAKTLFTQFLDDFGDAEEAQGAVKQVRPVLAVCLIRTREFDAAREALNVALKEGGLDPDLKQELLFWKGVCQLQASAYGDAQESFGSYYKQAPESDARRFEAAVLFATAYLLLKQHDSAITFCENQVPKLGKHSPEVAARLMALQLHALLQTDQLDEALSLAEQAAKRFEQFVQIIGLQTLMLDLGSRLLEGERYHEAIRCLRHVWPQERLIALQNDRKQRLMTRIRALKARGNADATVFQLDGILTRIEREVTHFATIKEYDAALRMRVARAYMGLQRYREAGLIMEAMLERMEPSPLVESASVSLVQCWMQVARWAKAVEAADTYRSRFGNDVSAAPNAAMVMFLKGQALQSARHYIDALAVFDECMEAFPNDDLIPQCTFMRGICCLQLDRYSEAVTIFKTVAVEHDDSATLVESAHYWEAMAQSFAGEHDTCLQLIRAYQDRHSDGYYRVDAQFRAAFALHALADYTQGIPALRDFAEQREDSTYADEARLLLGDAHLALGELEEGMEAYAQISPESVKFYEDGYFKTGKALRLSERFEDMRGHFERFVNERDESARVPEAVHWLAWLEQKEGRLENARDLYWGAVDQHGNDPEKTTMASLIGGLSKLYRGPDDLQKLLAAWDQRRQRALTSKQRSLAARSLWAQAQAMKRAQPMQATAQLIKLSAELDPEIHEAAMLADAADAQREMGERQEAKRLYQGIVKWHPNALERDRADAGLGFLAMGQRDFNQALEHFDRVERRGSGSVSLGDLVFAKAQCLDKMGQRLEALTCLEMLLADKSMASEPKARALVLSGQWIADSDKKKALVYFERVYVAYGKFSEQVAQAYFKRGELLELLGESSKAKELYTEMVSREDLKPYPEYAKANSKLGAP